MCEGEISQQPPRSLAPKFKNSFEIILNFSKFKSLFFPSAITGFDPSGFQPSGIYLKALTLKPKGKLKFLKSFFIEIISS